MTDVSTTLRKTLSPRARLTCWERHGGVCVICREKIDGVREEWIVEHVVPLAMGGPDEPSNMGPAHARCADKKTRGPDGDLATVARAKRRKARHIGIRKPSKFPCSRDSKWRKRIDGTIILRNGLEKHD